ncbi:hypothetical protein AT261_09840 [Bacillus cereus]|nr:hypothetical protein AT261_09840 [Bacillus cereus]PEX18053.1 hypothetical protein CN452_22645 [Bacillus cereus]
MIKKLRFVQKNHYYAPAIGFDIFMMTRPFINYQLGISLTVNTKNNKQLMIFIYMDIYKSLTPIINYK